MTMAFTPHAILVTGGAGFIGSNHVHVLLERYPDINVVTLDKLTYAGSLDNLANLPDPDRHCFVKGDIADQALVSRLLREHDIDAIINFAAESHVDRSITGPSVFLKSNVMGTFVLLEAAREFWMDEQKKESGQVRFLHVSTDEVYGQLGPEDPAFTETTPYNPSSPYSASKAASDHFAKAYHHTYGLPVMITNCSNNYGPRQHDEKLIPTIIRSCVLEQPIPVYGNGMNVRDWLYVTDHCHGIDRVLHQGRPGETYNIGGRNEWPNLRIVKKICAILDEVRPRRAGPHETLITFVTDRPGHDWRYAIDAGKLEAETGWCHEVTFEEGLRNTVAWYLGKYA